MNAVFVWGYGCDSKALAFWGWVEEAGGSGQRAKLAVGGGNLSRVVDNRKPLSMAATGAMPALINGTEIGRQVFIAISRKGAVISAGEKMTGKCVGESLKSKSGRIAKDAVGTSAALVDSSVVAGAVVMPEKVQS